MTGVGDLGLGNRGIGHVGGQRHRKGAVSGDGSAGANRSRAQWLGKSSTHFQMEQFWMQGVTGQHRGAGSSTRDIVISPQNPLSGLQLCRWVPYPIPLPGSDPLTWVHMDLQVQVDT